MSSKIGKRFGRLIVIGLAKDAGPQGQSKLECLCDCGTLKSIIAGNLGKHTNSCGCLNREMMSSQRFNFKHGMMKTPEYRAWIAMRQRCRDTKYQQYRNYGGRGIMVCERWESFDNFYADVGVRPSTKHSLDRYPDNNGNYEPGNVRWATQKEQTLNRRPRSEWTFGVRGNNSGSAKYAVCALSFGS